jgi:hypothetical protein
MYSFFLLVHIWFYGKNFNPFIEKVLITYENTAISAWPIQDQFPVQQQAHAQLFS